MTDALKVLGDAAKNGRCDHIVAFGIEGRAWLRTEIDNLARLGSVNNGEFWFCNYCPECGAQLRKSDG